MNHRPKIACISTIFHKYSHTQHFVDRFLEGYGWDNRHHRPAMDLVSLYVDQVGEDDLSRERAARFPQMKIYPTVADALTLGGDGNDGGRWLGFADCQQAHRFRRALEALFGGANAGGDSVEMGGEVDAHAGFPR